MKKYISPSRFKYGQWYRAFRLNRGNYSEEQVRRGISEESECALLSYDYHDSEFTGWTSRLRRARFLYRKTHVLPHAEFPF